MSAFFCLGFIHHFTINSIYSSFSLFNEKKEIALIAFENWGKIEEILKKLKILGMIKHNLC